MTDSPVPPPVARAEGRSAVVVLCAVPADFPCEDVAGDLVGASLAACVQIGPPITSVYMWKGARETSVERLLVIKTRAALFPQLEAALRARHPYEVPEIVALKVADGHGPYLDWIEAMTTR